MARFSNPMDLCSRKWTLFGAGNGKAVISGSGASRGGRFSCQWCRTSFLRNGQGYADFPFILRKVSKRRVF